MSYELTECLKNREKSPVMLKLCCFVVVFYTFYGSVKKTETKACLVSLSFQSKICGGGRGGTGAASSFYVFI